MSPPTAALVIVAHPDDCELGCGGTVAKWVDAGARVDLVVTTDGSKGSHDPELDDATLRDVREVEQRAAGEVLGLQSIRFLREVDGELAERPELVLALAKLIRALTPEIVVTHDPWRRYELHGDHIVTGRLVVRALYDAREPRAARELAARGLAPWRPRELFLFGADDTDHREDISGTLERKLEALLEHRSQHATTFRSDGDPASVRLAMRAYALAAAPDGATPIESFRRLTLPQ